MTNNQKAKLSVSNIIGIILLIIFLLLDVVMWLFGGFGEADSNNPVESVVQEEDEHVLMVKNGTNSNYPDQTYEEAFEAYFGSPTWEYFKGVQEGPDEDGDGEPDWTQDDVDVVEFTGDCLYQDVEVKACIQFVLNDDDTFTATYLEFNGVPQSTMMLVGLIDDVFTGDEQDVTESETTEMATTEEITEMDTTKVGEDVDPSVFNGSWYDLYSQRCSMEIICQNDMYYDITLDWGSSAWENIHWEFTGEYDAAQGGIIYQNGCCYLQSYPEDDGDMQQIELYNDGDGLIYMIEGKLYWNDKKEDVGKDCIFMRSESSYDLDNQEFPYADYILPNSDTVRLTEADVADLSLQEINYAKNEIYARHGRKFMSKELQDYFNGKDWYLGTVDGADFDDNWLSEIERDNIKLLNELEFSISPNGYQLDQ